jgi:two-component system sensor histidine kinase KdpD
MAERMGGKSVAIQGDNVVDEIIAYAKANHITKIIVGKTIRPAWKAALFGALADKIIRKSEHIDVYVVTGNPTPQEAKTGKSDLTIFKSKFYLWSLVAAAALTAFGMAMASVLTPIDQALIYLMGVVLVAAKLGRGPSFLYSLLSVTCFNFFFIPPLFSLDIYDRSYWLTFIVMLITSFVITSQASRLRLQAIFSRKRERETQAFYSLTREMASMREHQDMAGVAAKHIGEIFGVTSVIGLPDSGGEIRPIIGQLPPGNVVKENGVLQWCFDNGQIAGRHTTAMPSAIGLYFPLIASSGRLGVLGVIADNEERKFTGDEISALETCASLLASALERANVADLAQHSKVEAESEKLRTMLLSSVSHDLRTPLASITGAASTIATDIDILSHDTIRDLGRSINKEAERLSHLVSNLLEVTRLESGTVQLNPQPYFIEELIGSALARLEQISGKHIVVPRSDDALPLVQADGVLIEQVLINLVENAVRYTPQGSTIEISATGKGASVLISVTDNGPGIPAGHEKKIFDKFFSIRQKELQKGTGLGLAICANIVKLHKGDIWAENSAAGGARFCFTLPVADAAVQGGVDAAGD